MVRHRIVRPSLQSAPELPALDPPSVSKHDARLLRNFLTSGNLDFSSKKAIHLLVPWVTFIPILIFLHYSRAHTGQMDRQSKDKRTGKMCNAAYRMAA